VKAKRRTTTLLAVGLGAALIGVAACGQSGSGSASGSGKTITIAMFADTSGVNESVDASAIAGAKVAMAQINAAGGVLHGSKLALKIVPDPSDPAQMPSLVHQLAQQGIKVMSGGDQTAYCVAAAPTAEQVQILDVSESCAGAPLTGPKRLSKNFYTVGVSSYMVGSALAQTIVSKAPAVKKLYVVGYSVPPLEEVFQTVAAREKAANGATVGAQYFVPYTQDNFGSIVTSLMSKATGDPQSQALILTTFGDGTLSFLQQAQDAGLLQKFGFIGAGYTYYSAAVSLKGKAPALWDSYQYDDWHLFNKSAAGKNFISKYRALMKGAYPDDPGYGGYVWMTAMAKAIDSAGSLDYQKLVNAVAKLHFTSITGQVSVDSASHQFLVPIVVGKIGGDPSSPDDVGVSNSDVISGPAAFTGSFTCGQAFCP
jgi:branched-chain amino acid transport system substrate-binding protein